MNMCPIDWAVVVGLLTLMTIAAIRTKKYTRSVADFLAANRCAKRYVIGVSEGIAAIGAISVLAFFEAYYKGGLAYAWWGKLVAIIPLIIGMSGWVIYRFRQTRALTMAQFLEQRYSRKFRVFCGLVMFSTGLLNFGIFPAVGARFFMHLCGLESHMIDWYGLPQFDMTMAVIMFILLGIALFFTFIGGQIAVIVTDFIQGTFFNIVMCIIIIYCFIKFPWVDMKEVFVHRSPGFSVFNPYDAGKIGDFNIWYVMLALLAVLYTMKVWQGSQGYNSSAINPHEARMGNLLGMLRSNSQVCLIFLIPFFMYALMHHPKWVAEASATNDALGPVAAGVKSQVLLPASMVQFLPIGLLGGFCAVMLAAFISTNDTALHSWGSIFIQDVYLPIKHRKKPLEPKAHLRLLRLSIVCVAIFIFLFGLFYPQKQFIFMFCSLTGTIWCGGAGASIIGGLYWKRGTTAAAYSAIILGIIIAITGFILIQAIPNFPINGQWIGGIATLLCCLTYISVSLLGKRSVHNMDKLLHRGEYKLAEDNAEVMNANVNKFYRLIGINESFTRSDRFIYLFILGWGLHEFIWGVFWTIYTFVYKVTINGWGMYWRFWFWSTLAMPIFVTIWFAILGIRDLKDMFKRLKAKTGQLEDDGTVVHEASDTLE